MKKIISLLLSVITAAAVITPAFASESIDTLPQAVYYEAGANGSFNEEGISETGNSPDSVKSEGEELRSYSADETGSEEQTVESEDESLLSDAAVAIMYLCVSGPHAPYIFGHTWICIKNISDESLKVGNSEIAPGAMSSFGLHHFDGLHYDEEMRDYQGETVNARECRLTRKDLKSAEEEITNSRWHWYEYLTHNCTNFATSVWKKVTGQSFFAFCFPFVVKIQMAGAGLKKLIMENHQPDEEVTPA